MLDLYFWTTPNGYKVAILLEELGLQYNVVPNDVISRKYQDGDLCPSICANATKSFSGSCSKWVTSAQCSGKPIISVVMRRSAYAIEFYTREAKRLYRALDKRLGEAEFLAGDYSIADMAVYPWLRPHKWQGQDISTWPNLQRWYNAVRARFAVSARLSGDE